MAFHVACPITCRKICFCVLGFPRNLHGKEVKDVFLNQIHSVEECLLNPWNAEVSKDGTVQIHVPKLAVFDTGPRIAARNVGVGSDSAMEVVAVSSNLVPAKRTLVLQKKVVEDYAVNDGSGDLEVSVKELNVEDHDHHSASITCHMCYLVEVGKSERAKMLSCKCCGKKYHRNCLKSWAQHRDLFNWSSWACPSCRICEGCGTLGDPKKFMFCKRCDDAYHCDCQQPRHKNVSSGPYLCPKHTKCYSCGSTVPGNGQSLRWFLGHTCCDACGRLFVKGNYCPVCLKVYRDSEATPMVCCDFCQRWVHCHCDGISDEKYMQFQVDGNLQYKCSTCRGECYQVKDLEDAVQEIWKRKDMADKDLIASLKASARVAGQTSGAPLVDQPGSVERKVSEKAMVNGEEEKPLRVLRIKSSRTQDSDSEKFGKHATELNTVKAKKLVISIGPRKTGVTNSTSCVVSKLTSKSNGKQEKLQSEEMFSQEQHRSLLGKNNDEKRGSRGEVATSKAEGGFIGRHSDGKGDLNSGSHDSLQKDSRRLLKLRIKKHNPESQEGEAPSIVYERGKSGKGHRSKRKRASPPAEKSAFNEDEDVSLSREDSLLDEMLDASWILKKLGKDAKGKKVQIHEASDDSWEKGEVSEVGGGAGTSKLMVTLENGKVKTVELGKQGVRFVPQKQKRTRT
ncbi:Zinc finger RING-type [Arabidopsis suecica]|uniref:Zinc finger RING-type n=1 Tax=Arabidopsis suecica TaxID=45249 RepID=A0A8T2A0P1_ARASU|nr:Zinc finger RING-type [Arabidopsis suecica]